MAKYSSKEFLYARPLAYALLTDTSFRQWFFAGTKFADRVLTSLLHTAEQAKLRTTADSRKWFWFNYWCPKDGSCECRGEKGIETDILLILEEPAGSRFSLHVEVKQPGENFLPGQAESYPRRGLCWTNSNKRPRTVPAHDDFLTAIVCGDNLKHDARLLNFDKTIFHSDVEQKISPYPDLTDLRYQ